MVLDAFGFFGEDGGSFIAQAAADAGGEFGSEFEEGGNPGQKGEAIVCHIIAAQTCFGL